MKQSRLTLAILLFCTSFSSSILSAGNRLSFIPYECSVPNLTSEVTYKQMKTDPFIGVFTMSAYGQIVGNVTITHLGGSQYKVDSGDGHDIAIKNGSILEGISQGIPFRILINGDNLVMEVLGSAFDLNRISEKQVRSENSVIDKDAKSENSDPFVGDFEIFSENNVRLGKTTIKSINGLVYEMSTESGVDFVSKNGNQLDGISNGEPFRITPYGNDLSINFKGVDMQLKRLVSNQIASPTPVSTTMDKRLLGVWRYTNIQKSESSRMVTDYSIGFKKDGTYNTKTSWAGMGSSGENPQHFGQCQIVSTNETGGRIRLDGNEMEYFFSGNSVQIGTTIYEFIRN